MEEFGEMEWEEEAEEDVPLCVECGEKGSGRCDFCEDCLCGVCFLVLHRKGKRRNHQHLPFSSSSSSPSSSSSSYKSRHLPVSIREKSPAWFSERAKYIPLRLSQKERKKLKLLDSALKILRYTDVVDVSTFKNEGMRKGRILKEITSILDCLTTSLKRKDRLGVLDKKFEDFYQEVFEIGRRYKVMNPEKMRSEYGKLIYLLQDTVSLDIQEHLGFSCTKPLITVYSYLQSKGVAHLLEDPYVATATMEIESRGRKRCDIQMEIKEKERKRDFLAQKYETKRISSEEIKWCLYSIGDNHSYLHFNRDPVNKIIDYLNEYFPPSKYEKGYSLAIWGGANGARLTHDHKKQYCYILQSLYLWREITQDMFKLWVLAEQDLLNPQNPYTLLDTGQGLQRVQNAPKIFKCIQKIVVNTQKNAVAWVGSSVIHLGDKNVPNALLFIDKYTQIQRILNPIISTLDQIDKWEEQPIKDLIASSFGGPKKLKKDILVDFFRFGFDGSGADNFFDAGSCIDGRLTSAWNWCNKLDEKPFYHIFRLASFAGFDGDFQM